MNLCRNALRSLGASLIIGLGFFSGDGPIELVIYDDQSAPANVPNIYTKLITVDKVDLLLGPYGTNFVAPAMPTIIQNNKLTISFTAIGINDKFHYPKILLDGVGWAGGCRFVLDWLL